MARALFIHRAKEGAAFFRLVARFGDSGWYGGALVLAAFAATPLLVLLARLFMPEHGVWQHLAENVLGDLVLNTVLLLGCIIPQTLVLGVGLGWLTGACEFPGRRFFAWALVLPFAVPPYVFAFVYLGMFDFGGPVQTALRAAFPAVGFIDIRNVSGVSFILSLAFYPYVYLMSRSAFMTQGRTALEVARTLGQSPARAFFTVALPMARPFIAAGLLLVCMETLADFGAVSIFNYDTFTTAIYKAWFGMFSLSGAAQLSSVLVVFVLCLIVSEQFLRRRMRFSEAGRTNRSERLVLQGGWKWAAFSASLLVFIVSFALPCLQLAVWGAQALGDGVLRYVEYAFNTLLLGIGGTVIVVAAALLLAFARKSHGGLFINFSARIATLGYALPGTVLAVGIFIPAAWLDSQLLNVAERLTGLSFSPFVQGSVGLLVGAYCIRFLAAGYGSVDSAMQRITPSIGDAARSLGVTGFSMLGRVYLPMLKKGMITAAILVLVDIMKEMPITLMMRPFGWDTLAVKLYEYTAEAEWQLAAIPAVALIAAGVVPVLLLTKQMEEA